MKQLLIFSEFGFRTFANSNKIFVPGHARISGLKCSYTRFTLNAKTNWFDIDPLTVKVASWVIRTSYNISGQNFVKGAIKFQ